MIVNTEPQTLLKLERTFTDASGNPYVGYLVRICTEDSNQPVQQFYVKTGAVYRVVSPTPQFLTTDSAGKITTWLPQRRYSLKLIHPTTFLVLQETDSVTPASDFVKTSELTAPEVEDVRELLVTNPVLTVNGEPGPHVVLSLSELGGIDPGGTGVLLDGVEVFVLTNVNSWSAGRVAWVYPRNSDTITVKTYVGTPGTPGGTSTTVGAFTIPTSMTLYLDNGESAITSVGFTRSSGSGTASTYFLASGPITG